MASSSSSCLEDSNEGINKRRKILDDLLFDCELSDCGLLPRTFWMPVDGTKPRFGLEQMALEIFHHHIPPTFSYDKSTSGAEWWVQIRPSPAKTGRYSMLSPSIEEDDDDDMAKSGISFHWDKDEDLRLMMGGSMYIHPHISTVTYLTDLGAPTMVLTARVNNFTGEWMVPSSGEKEEGIEGYISCPKQGKHLSFDGRYLHAAPSNFMKDGYFEEQCQFSSSSSENTKLLQRRHRRVTFLVNLWLNYKPFNVELFPDTMVDKMTPVCEDDDLGCYLFCNGASSDDDDEKTNEAKSIVPPCPSQNVTFRKNKTTALMCNNNKEEHQKQDETQHLDDAIQYTWPLGGCDSNETIRVHVPIHVIRNEMIHGGNVNLAWHTFQQCTKSVEEPPGVYLDKGSDEKAGGGGVGEGSTTEIIVEAKEQEEVDETTKDDDESLRNKRQRVDE
mmetsp:Transcript_26715/g.39699  ORF Transcript_26715/g.39699 Transcript_26715/m.39699 type:complete len:444 (-) Transcript_26715:44-1375(-)